MSPVGITQAVFKMFKIIVERVELQHMVLLTLRVIKHQQNLTFGSDRGVLPEPQKLYPFLRFIFAKKRYPFLLRIFFQNIGQFCHKFLNNSKFFRRDTKIF